MSSYNLPFLNFGLQNRSLGSKIVTWGLEMWFFSLPKIIIFFACVFSRKNCENQGFWPPKTIPKPFQNAFQIDVPKNMQFYIYFSSIFSFCWNFDFLKISVSPRREHYFWGFCWNHASAIFMYFSFKKPTKNPSKTTAEPFKNRCPKRVVFQHRFLRVWASILEPLGPPRWSQVGLKSQFSSWGAPFFTFWS